MSKKKLPIVAIIGRANVGKSSLFNAILHRRETIVANEPGVTRDSIMAKATIVSDNKNQDFWIVDTAGMKDPEDDFEFTIQEQITQAADSADIIIVMTEAGAIVSDEDRKIAKTALRTKKPIILVANKLDKYRRKDLSHLQKFGISNIFATSVTQSRGIDDLLTCLSNIMPKVVLTEDDNRLRIALLGRPNVGKSSLFNTLAKKQQAIVSARAGTTRDINRVIIRYKNREIELLDTAGIRRSGKIEVGIEKFSVIRSLSAIEQADICLLLIDVNEPHAQLDQKIAGIIKEAGKGLVLVVSKWDSIDKSPFTRDQMAPKVAADFDFVPWAPLVFTSSVSGQNVTKLFDIALEIEKNRQTRIKTSELNKWLISTINKHPPVGLKNKTPKLHYITQESDNPTPNFKVFGSQTRFLHWSYKRFMERSLRQQYNFEGTPLFFWFFDKNVHYNLEKRAPRKGKN